MPRRDSDPILTARCLPADRAAADRDDADGDRGIDDIHHIEPSHSDRERAASAQLLRDLAHTREGAWVTCAGDSMTPTIARGALVRVRAYGSGESARTSAMRPGDVVLFETAAGDAVILHRVALIVPRLGWFVHVGDIGLADGLGLAHRRQVIGRAQVPRRPVPRSVYRAALRRLGRAALRRLRR